MPRATSRSQRRKDLRALAVLMNKQNVEPLPVISRLIDIFELVITVEECAFLLQVGTEPHTYEGLRSIAGMTDEAFHPFIDTQLKKGLLWPKRGDDGVETYRLAAIMFGWFEVYFVNADPAQRKEFVKRLDRLMETFGKMNFFPLRNLRNYQLRRHARPLRTIAAIGSPHRTGTVRISVDQPVKAPEPKVYPASTVLELIEKYGRQNQIAVVECFCREWRRIVDEPCRFDIPDRSCMVIGQLVPYVLKYDSARAISKEDALALVAELQKKGAIHQVFHEREDVNLPEVAICNCCWDCCGVLGSYNRGIIPLVLKSYYYAREADAGTCSVCGECEKYCPTAAIKVVETARTLDIEKCIGCGQCVPRCPQEALELVYQERKVFLPLRKRADARIPA